MRSLLTPAGRGFRLAKSWTDSPVRIFAGGQNMPRHLVTTIVFAAVASSASAELLGTHTISHSGGGPRLATAMAFAFGWGEDPPGIVDRLFEDVPVTLADVGHTFAATEQTDPHFATIAAGLTDGTSEGVISGQQVRFYSYFYPDGGGRKPWRAGEHLPGRSDLIDFHGFQITRSI
jgi:hypothetical protein